MSSTLIPAQDLVPSVSSRVVTIDATSMLEATPNGRFWVDFILPQDLHVAADNKIIMAGSERVTLNAGKGSIRLPTYDPDAKTIDGSNDWVILVKKSWTGGCSHGRGCGCGGAYAIRVPVGTSNISLADLPAVRALTPRERQWAVTGAGVTIVEGSQWGASVDLQGGVLRFVLTVPPGGTAYYRGTLGTATLGTVTETGVYAQPFAANATTARGYPIQESGILTVTTESASATTWQVWEADSGRGRWKRVRISGAWSAWERQTSSFQNRGLLGSRNLNTVTDDGVWHQIYSSGATSALNYPVDTSGTLTVSTAGDRVYQWYSADADRGEFRRVSTAGVWGAWNRTSSTLKNRGTLGTFDLDTVVQEGTWYQRWASLATSAAHYPVAATGQLEVRTLLAETGTRSQEFYPDDMSLGAWRRVAQASVWSAWFQIGGATGSDAAIGAMVRRDRARSRKGGRIGTAGRAVVSLRFDDAHDAMAATVAPLLRQYRLPAYQAVTVRNVEENSSRTWAQIQALVSDGVEVFGHSWTHQAASGYGNIRKEVIDSAAYMETQMPGVAIEGWVMPGTGQSGTEAYDGFGPGGTVEAFTDTAAGRMILSRYAVPCGSIQGHLMPLNGAPVTGQVHWTFESATLAQTQAMVRQAQATGTGITLMAHPSRFGEAGFMSVADLTSLLSWLASERDAERLLVLTGTGQAFADSSTSERMNVVPALEESAYPGSGWTFSNGVASSEGSGLLTYAAASVGVNHLRGGVLELSALVNAPTGGVLRTQVSGGAARTEDHTIPSGSGWRWVRMLVHYPTTAGVSAGLTVNIRRTSGGAINMANLALQPV